MVMLSQRLIESRTNSKDLDRSSNKRMAGQALAREQEMVTNPEEAKRTCDWMRRFSVSNQGFEWNQGRMNMEAYQQTGEPLAPQGGQEAQ